MLTFGKWLATKKNITTKIQRISPCCSAADSSTNSRHNNFTFSNVLTFQISICRFVASCKRKQICFCKMVTEWKLLCSYSYLFLKGLRVSSIVRERRQREEEYSCQSCVYEILEENDAALYAKNVTVKNIITINKYSVGMKSLDQAIIVSDTLKTETSPIFIS